MMRWRENRNINVQSGARPASPENECRLGEASLAPTKNAPEIINKRLKPLVEPQLRLFSSEGGKARITRRPRVYRYALLALLIFLAACGPSPKATARDWAERFPLEIGSYEQDDDWLELTPENQTNTGHITLTYEGDDDQLIYISIDTFATETAAEVRLSERLREWELLGARFERERISGEPIDVARTPGGYLGIYHNARSLISLRYVPALPEDEENETEENAPETPAFELPADDITAFLETLIAIADAR